MTEYNHRRATDRPSRSGVMLALMIAAAAFIVGRVTGQVGLQTVREAESKPVPRELPQDVTRWHDATMHVTCWQFARSVDSASGLSCLPDAQVATVRPDEAP